MSPVGGGNPMSPSSALGDHVSTPQKLLRHNFHSLLDESDTGVLSDTESYVSAESNVTSDTSPAKKTQSNPTIQDIKPAKPELKPKPAIGAKPQVKPKPKSEDKTKQKEKAATSSSYSDFVQYSEPKVSLEKEENPPTVMQACVNSFQQLFRTIVASRVVNDVDMPTILMQQLAKEKCSANSELESTFHLHRKVDIYPTIL